jgi:hypothetical protein
MMLVLGCDALVTAVVLFVAQGLQLMGGLFWGMEANSLHAA